ncbi:TPA: formamidase, partial [Candidatus Bathyarchaeota archaeon]|nr:formamidase [Candidatus Bathyarchaeota archaeon]
MKRVRRDKLVYEFSGFHDPVEYADPGEIMILETEDALGGQIKDEATPLENLDW